MGAMAWGLFIAAYNLGGALFLLMRGQWLFFLYPEWFIYGGIGMGVTAVALINVIALSNRSYIYTRVCKFLWPFIIVIVTIRAILMIWQLHRGKDKIIWECENGGQLWNDPNSTTLGTGHLPSAVCAPGWSSLFTAFIISLLVDIACQIYMLFLNWRFTKREEHYRTMKGPMMGGYYGAS
jgi:hypothetical protein